MAKRAMDGTPTAVPDGATQIDAEFLGAPPGEKSHHQLHTPGRRRSRV